MEYIVLGLLLLQSRSIYELRARIEQGINLMYSSSMGSIQAAIKKLLQNGHIACQEVSDGRRKKIYSITPSGAEYFLQWVNLPLDSSMKNPDLIKIYFMGFSEPSLRAANIRRQVETLTGALRSLELTYGEAKGVRVPADYADIANYQLVTVEYGIESLKFHIRWYQALLDRIEKGEL